MWRFWEKKIGRRSWLGPVFPVTGGLYILKSMPGSSHLGIFERNSQCGWAPHTELHEAAFQMMIFSVRTACSSNDQSLSIQHTFSLEHSLTPCLLYTVSVSSEGGLVSVFMKKMFRILYQFWLQNSKYFILSPLIWRNITECTKMNLVANFTVAKGCK